MKPLPSFLILALLARAAAARPLDEHQIRVTASLAQPGVQLASSVRLVDGEDGSRIIEVQLKNDSRREVNLLEATVEFPWVPATGDGLRVAAGATATGRWPPTRVVDPARDRTDPASGMYLMARSGGGCSLAGFVTWKTFWSTLRYRDGGILMTADGEGRRLRAGESVALETIVLMEGTDWQDLLFRYAGAIARELHLAPKPACRLVGWSTWDYYGRDWTPAEVAGNLSALLRLVPAANLVQIDAGWWARRGDFDPRPDLGPNGLKRLAAAIHARGLRAGIYLDGMRAAADSDVARRHPEYFLHDRHGALIRDASRAGGDGPYLLFDYSNLAACAYVRDGLRRLRDWGFDYLKIDYLRAGIAEDIRRGALRGEPGRAIAPFDPGLTSVERFHRALAAFRQGMGADAYLLGCSTPFGLALGQVEGLRTGPDISPRFSAYRSQCEANAGNFYLEGRVAQVDADYEVVRSKEDQDATLVKDPGKNGDDLTLNEAGMWTDYVAMFSGTKLAGDDLMILRDRRKELVRFAATREACSRFLPLDFWRHARTRSDAFEVFLGVAGSEVDLALFNWSDGARTYRIGEAPSVGLRDLQRVRGEAGVAPDPAGVRITLAARHAAIFRLPPGVDFDRARRAIRLR
jgi:alpha-galactosidase